jgi:PAS domain S-box-containing protein
VYLIGDVAALTGLTTHVLRAWERVGLLAPSRSAGGVRRYSEDDVASIRLVARTLDSRRYSRRTVAAMLQSGELRPAAVDYAPGPARSLSRNRPDMTPAGDEQGRQDTLAAGEARRERRVVETRAHGTGAAAVGRNETTWRRRSAREACLAAVARAAAGPSGAAGVEGRTARLLEALARQAGVPVVVASLHLLDRDTGMLQSAGTYGGDLADAFRSAGIQSTEHPAWRALEAGAIYSGEGRSPPDWISDSALEAWSASGICAWAVVPLRVGDTVLGALSIGLGVLYEWDDEERAWLEACADAMALAVENDWLFAAERQRAVELEAVLACADVGITLVARDGRMLWRNPAAEALTAWQEYQGTLSENVETYPLRDALTDAPVPLDDTPVRRALRGEAVRDAELVMRDGHEHDRVLRSSSQPVRDAAGQVVAAVTTFRDVTAHMRRTRLFGRLGREMGASLEPIAEMRAMADALVEVGAADTIAIYGAAQDGKYLQLLATRNYPPEVSEFVLQMPASAPTLAAQALRTGTPQVVPDFGAITREDYALAPRLAEALGIKSGVVLPLLARGRVAGVMVAGARQLGAFGPDEVTLLMEVAAGAGLALDNAQLYQQARRTAAELDAVLNAMVDAVWVCDTSGQLTWVNTAAAAWMGSASEGVAQPVQDYLAIGRTSRPDGQAPSIEEPPLARALRGETATDHIVTIYQEATGRDVQLLLSFGPIRDVASGAIVGAIAVGRDVTRLRELEQARADFLTVATHELKTPLTSLLGVAQTARRREARARQARIPSPQVGMTGDAAEGPNGDLLERIERHALRLDRLVNDLVDVARIQQERMPYHWAVADLVGAVAEAVGEQRAAYPDRQIDMRVPDEPLMARLDVDRLGQVVDNLLTNALKYSRADRSVLVAVEASGREAGEPRQAMVRVQDAGLGIAAEHLPHLFEQFYRAPGVEVQSGSGIGLGVGLYVAHEIVEQHRGRIWAESEPGRGSTFIFTVPLIEDADDEAHSTPAP